MRLSSLLILAFSIVGIGAQTPCSGSGTGTWTDWTNSTACADCETAGTPANGVYGIRLCVPPKGSNCIYDTYSCSGDTYEATSCGETTTTSTTSTTPTPATTSHVCGEWEEWSCTCCGGCSTGRCRRGWITDGSACPAPTVSPADYTKEDSSTSCISPSQVCSFPLTICCDGQTKYINTTAKSYWCKTA
ncbi:hypothetical protein FO519_009711 [Halicephalobus sp. NKZ332]|nr:hypothetical protein FO519_009711 [Halicephalobus sp. NKZ332]